MSDDEAAAQGLQVLRAHLSDNGPDAPTQALRMLAMRYPEEAGKLEALWNDPAAPQRRHQLEELLTGVERQRAEDAAE